MDFAPSLKRDKVVYVSVRRGEYDTKLSLFHWQVADFGINHLIQITPYVLQKPIVSHPIIRTVQPRCSELDRERYRF